MEELRLFLLDVENYIQRNGLKPVNSLRVYEASGKLDVRGLFSEEIFGRLGSQERRTKFGYINLKLKIIHPEAMPILTGVNPELTKLITTKENKLYTLTSDGMIEESADGDNGVYYFVKIYKDLNWAKLAPKKPEKVDFIKKNIDKLIISKWLVLPAGVRDIRLSKASGKTITEMSDLSTLYSGIIRQVNAIPDDPTLMPEDLLATLAQSLQHGINDVNKWIKDRLKGKQGIIRGGLLKKTIDYSGRMVIAGDQDLEMGTIGIPWQQVLKLYEPFTINYLLNEEGKVGLELLKNLLKTEQYPDVNDLKRFLTKLSADPGTVPAQTKDHLVDVAKKISEGKQLLYKRDPAEERDHWLSGEMRVDTDGHTLRLSALDLPRLKLAAIFSNIY